MVWTRLSVFFAGLILGSTGCLFGGEPRTIMGSGNTVDAVAYVRKSIEEYPIVALAEGNHATREPHAFLQRVLSDEGVLRAVDVVIVEFATALEQPVLDAYIAGDEVPFDELSRVWRNTSVSPVAPWDSPVYADLLAVVREANLGLPPEERVRVLAGDPPMDWAHIETREDYGRAVQPRDPYVARLAVEQAFELGLKVLIIFGGAHLPRVPVGEDGDLRNPLSYLILREHPGSMCVVGFLNTENLGLADRAGELLAGTAVETATHWVGELEARNFFPGILSRITDPETGEASWQEVPLYTDYRVRDLFDALVYIGPSSEWHVVSPSLDEKRDEAYLKELDRRRSIRFGGRPGGTKPSPGGGGGSHTG